MIKVYHSSGVSEFPEASTAIVDEDGRLTIWTVIRMKTHPVFEKSYSYEERDKIVAIFNTGRWDFYEKS